MSAIINHRFRLLLILVVPITCPANADQVRTVALTGQQAPGTASGAAYSGFFLPVINNAGQTAFNAALSGSGVTGSNYIGMWSEGSGSLALAVREGSQAPGTASDVTFS